MADDTEEESRSQSNTIKSDEKEKGSMNRSELDQVLRRRFVKSAEAPSSHSPAVDRVRESEAVSPVLRAEHIPKSFFVAKPKEKSVDKLQIRSVDKSKQRIKERSEQKSVNRVQKNVSSFESKNVSSFESKNVNSFESKNGNSFESKNGNSFESKNVSSFESKNVSSFESKNVNSFESKNGNSFESKNGNSFESKNVSSFESKNGNSFESKNVEQPAKKDINPSSQVKLNTTVQNPADIPQQKSKEQSEQDSGELSTEKTDKQTNTGAQSDESPILDPSPPPVDYHIGEVTIGRKTTFDLDALLGDLDLEQDLLETLPTLETIKESSVSVDDKTEVVNDLVDVNDLWECVVVYDYQADTNETLSVHVGEHVWGVSESGDWTQIRTEKGEVGFVSSR